MPATLAKRVQTLQQDCFLSPNYHVHTKRFCDTSLRNASSNLANVSSSLLNHLCVFLFFLLSVFLLVGLSIYRSMYLSIFLPFSMHLNLSIISNFDPYYLTLLEHIGTSKNVTEPSHLFAILTRKRVSHYSWNIKKTSLTCGILRF